MFYFVLGSFIFPPNNLMLRMFLFTEKNNLCILMSLDDENSITVKLPKA